MKKRSFALTVVLALTLALTGCSAGRVDPSHGLTGSDSGVYETGGGNDAFEGGGAGGTNDRDNDGQPDDGFSENDVRRGAGKLVPGVGSAVDDAVDGVGDAVDDAVDDVGRAMR